MSEAYYKFCSLIAFLTVLNLFYPCFVCGQDSLKVGADTLCVQKDAFDLIRELRNKPPRIKTENSSSLFLIPIVGANPSIGLMFGVGGQFAFKMPGSSLYSSVSGSAEVTTKSQVIFVFKNNIYTKNNRVFLSGDWRYLIFSQDTYGLGTNSPQGGQPGYQFNLNGVETTEPSLSEPMKFDFARMHQFVSYAIMNNLYFGVGYNLDYYFNIIDENLRTESGDTVPTSHYTYNTNYNFSTTKYYSSALNASLLFDSRDNMINPYKGYYFMASWQGGLRILGNKKFTNFFQVEWRSFHSLSKDNPRHLIAFWILGNFSKPGEFPYMILPATAYDQRSCSGRGYTQGRFRGNNLVYGETEYRFPISKCGGILGGVLFLNATTASDSEQPLRLFESVKPGYGVGLRIMLDKASRTNLAMDFGFGNKSSGFYLSASETF